MKGSTFIGSLSPASDKLLAENFIDKTRRKYYDATHNCFAYRIHKDLFRYSDDGEPSGTAGQPILSMIDKYEIIQVSLVVTRYFGGTKLGTGGLIRAYSDCAETVIKQAKVIRGIYFKKIKIAYPFEMINKVQHLVQKYDAKIQEDATPGGMISSIEVPQSKKQNFETDLNSVTAGRVQFIQTD